MALPWLRLYREWASDPKVQMMPEHMQRRHIMLLCAQGETLQETERAFHWRISTQELAETKAIFIEKGFIDDDWNILKWDRRQYLSDNSTDRVRRYRRAKKQAETLHGTDETKEQQPSADTVTPPDQSRVNQNRVNQNRVSDASASSPRRQAAGKRAELCIAIYSKYPRKEARGAALKAIDKALGRLQKGDAETVGMSLEEAFNFLCGRTDLFASSPAGQRPDKSKIPHASTFFNQERYFDDPEAWSVVGETWEKSNPTKQRVDANLQAADAALARRGISPLSHSALATVQISN